MRLCLKTPITRFSHLVGLSAFPLLLTQLPLPRFPSELGHVEAELAEAAVLLEAVGAPGEGGEEVGGGVRPHLLHFILLPPLCWCSLISSSPSSPSSTSWFSPCSPGSLPCSLTTCFSRSLLLLLLPPSLPVPPAPEPSHRPLPRPLLRPLTTLRL